MASKLEMDPFFDDLLLSVSQKVTETLGQTIDFDQITVNEYNKGDGIASHVDTHSAFGPVILSLSLLSGVSMKFTHPTNSKLDKVFRLIFFFKFLF